MHHQSIQKILYYILLSGLFIFYPAYLIYNNILGYILFVVLKAVPPELEGAPGLEEVATIDATAGSILSLFSIIAGTLILKRHKASKFVSYSLISTAFIYYLLEPVWLRLSGFPVEVLQGQLYEQPLSLLKPIASLLVFIYYFSILNKAQDEANK